MNRFSKFVVASLLALGLLVPQVSAEFKTYSITNAHAGCSNIVSGYILLRSLTVYNSDTNALNVWLADSPGSLTYTNANVTNTVLSTTVTNTTVYTNFWGVLETNSFLMRTNTTSVTAAATNAYPTVMLLPIPASSYITYTPISPGRFLQWGLSITNAITNGAVVIDYQKF